jgi:hypothetical protein
MEKLATIHHNVAISSGTVVEHLPSHLIVAGLSPATATQTRMEKNGKKVSSQNG